MSYVGLAPPKRPFNASTWASGLLRALQGKPRRTMIKEVKWFCFLGSVRLIFLVFGARQVGLGVCGLGGAGTPKSGTFKAETWASGLLRTHQGNPSGFRVKECE